MAPGREPFLSFTGAASAEDRPRLYCFPYAGGSSSIYATWARALAPKISVFGVDLPGHGSRFQEDPVSSVLEMAAGIADAIAGSASRAPFALYGHSLGAVVAFETALLLQRTGRTAGPIHLFVGAARGPHLPPPVPAISHLPQDEFLDAVQHRYGGLPAALFEEPELLELVLPILRSDFRAYENYLYTGSLATGSLALACPVTAFHGANDPIVRSADVSEWSRMTANGFKMQVVEGDHFFLNTHRDVLLAHVRECFARPTAGPDLLAQVLHKY